MTVFTAAVDVFQTQPNPNKHGVGLEVPSSSYASAQSKIRNIRHRVITDSAAWDQPVYQTTLF